MYGQASSSRPPALPGTTEFDILKASHKFLREDEDADETKNASWEDRVAQKYYASLYREFAVCDLKHYKSGNFALRWRTEGEVLSGAGEETCGNARCPLHDPNSSASSKPSSLKTVELPFAYEEHGEHKSALVKVVLCDSCLKKIMYKREKERRERERKVIEDGREEENNGRDSQEVKNRKHELVEDEHSGRERSRRRERHEEHSRKRRKSRSRSRSQSPSSHRRKREHKDKHKRHDHSPL